jgi:hypothetical protein
MLLVFPTFVACVTNVKVFTKQAMIHFEENLLVALRTLCVMALVMLFEVSLCLSEFFFDFLREFVPAHWA